MIAALVLAGALADASPAPAPSRVLAGDRYAHHTVSSSAPGLQTMFDRGLTLFYAYNGSQGAHVFQAAVDADPRFAMGYWGLALSYGRDINTDLTEDHFKRAHAAIEKAASLEAGLTAPERAYVDAMRLRYAGAWRDRDNDEDAYRHAMGITAAHFADDDDLAALYAEALLENSHQNVWKAGTNSPATPDTTTMVSVLDRVIARNPEHIMANHLLIHIFESAVDRTRSIAAAKRLDAMSFAPEDEHLAHMPAHTWIDIGDYRRAVASSKRAIALFDRYLAQPDLDRAHKGYLGHDIRVGWGAALMLGNYASARWFATRLLDNAGPDDRYGTATALRFGDPQPFAPVNPKDPKDSLHAFVAYADLVRGNIGAAKAELAPLFDPQVRNNFVWVLEGRLALIQGDRKTAEGDFAKAVALEKDQYGGENLPSFPSQELMGFGLYRAGDFNAAERSFRDALKLYPNDPRALFGLSRTLQREGRAPEAQRTLGAFQKLWQGSDTALSIDQL